MQTRSPSRSTLMLACFGAVVIVLVFVASGGIAYLLLSRNSGPELATYTGDGYSFSYPKSWKAADLSADDKKAGEFLEIAYSGRDISFFDYDTKYDPRTECEQQAQILAGFYEDGVKNEELEPTEIDGKRTYHRRLTGTYMSSDGSSKGQKQVEDLYCVRRDKGVIEISAVDASSAEQKPVAEMDDVIKSWKWS